MSISVRNGSFGHGNRPPLFERVSFDMAGGDVLAVLGPNGAGKTTLLRCMMGLLPWREGETRLNGILFNAVPHRERWKTIAYVPQARGKAPAYTVRDMVLLGRGAFVGTLAMPKAADVEAAEESMRAAGVSHLADRMCTQLSGGELQMVLIARAMAAEPSVMVLDEPESNLDFRNQLLILDLISRLSKQRGIACILNTHYPEHALRVANKALLLKRGGYHIYGDAADVITEDNLKALFDVHVKIGGIRAEQRDYKVVLPLSIVREHSVRSCGFALTSAHT